MISVLILVLCACSLGDARPSDMLAPKFGTMIIGGVDASTGEFPWQISQQRQGTSGAWSHSCGGSLLSNTRTLSAAHCVDGANAVILRVIAGLHDRSNTVGTQTANAQRYVMHERYNNAEASYSNDVAIIHLVTAITTGSTIQFARLPANNDNNFAGTTCVASGWGRTSNSNVLPDVLQKAPVSVLSLAQCNQQMTGVGAALWAGHVCIYDTAGNGVAGACNGDSGGPLNCPEGSERVVAGIASFVVSSILGNCRPDYPSVYTRTSAYLSWIQGN